MCKNVIKMIPFPELTVRFEIELPIHGVHHSPCDTEHSIDVSILPFSQSFCFFFIPFHMYFVLLLMNGHVYMLIPIIQFPYHIPHFSPSYIISPSTRSFYTSAAPTALRIYRLPCMYMQADIDCHILISGSNSSPDRTPVHSADPDLPSACPSVTSNPVYPKLNICSVFPCFRNGTTNLTVASLSP